MAAAASAMATIVPDSSALDDREYRAFTLQNGLSVLLVSDPSSDKAAAAMDIAVGTFSDPPELPGLAHFCEHMLFLGTERYPDEASYSQYLAEKGGYSNAYTSHENTNFHFQLMAASNGADALLRQQLSQIEITEEKLAELGIEGIESATAEERALLIKEITALASQGFLNGGTVAGGQEASTLPSSDKVVENPLYEALSRFSQFFIAPLFTESATERELKAVDSEHQKNVQNDGQRLYQLSQSCSNKAHPYSRFGTGTKKTLWDDPQSRGLDTRSALLQFHEKYYSANRMNLCISGPHSLDTMQEWTEELFNPIRNSNIDHPSSEYCHEAPLKESEMGRIMRVVPIKDIHTVELSWLIPPIKASIRRKPAHYLAHVLGHEGKGSLLSLLKSKGWVDGVSAGPSTNAELFSFFDIQVYLTKDGMEHVDEIVGMVFGFINLIEQQGVQKWIYDESAALSDMAFRFAEREEPFNYVQRLSSQMSVFTPKEYLSGHYSFREYDRDEIVELLKCLSPGRVNIMVSSKNFDGSTDAVEPWYGTEYSMERISASKLDAWASMSPDPGFSIPEPNPFIPSDFSLIAGDIVSKDSDLEGPKVLMKNEQLELYHKVDRTFRRPKAAVIIKLNLPLAYSSPMSSVLSNMFISLVGDELNEFAYDAEVAGLRYSLKCMIYGIHISVSGYSDRLDVLETAIIEKIASLDMNEDRFEMIRDQWERQWANFEKEQPYQHAMYNMNYLLETPRWHVQQYLECIRSGKVTVEAVRRFVPQLLERATCIMLVHGNVTEHWSQELGKQVCEKLGFTSLGKAELPVRRVAQVPTAFEVVTRSKGPNKADNNSAIHVCYQVGMRGDFDVDVRLELLTEIMNKPAFHELRTKQQLGYVLWVGVDSCENVRGIYVIIQSTIADPEELDRRIEDFLVQFRSETLTTLTDGEFDGFVQSMIALKSERDKRLSDRTSRFWGEISSGDMLFNRADFEINALRNVKKSNVVDFFDRFIGASAPDRRKISTHVYGCDHQIPQDKPMGRTPQNASRRVRVVADPIAFKLSMPTYPVSGKHNAFL